VNAPLALLLTLAACAPAQLEPASPARGAADRFLQACAAGDDAAWRAELVRAERDDPQWSPGAFAGGRVIEVELRERLAIARFTHPSPRAGTRPLVLRFEDQSWRVSLAESLAAWAAEPSREGELLARP
jgi:hypothetical protein